LIVCQNGVLIEVGGRGQFPLEWLHNTPFSDYTIPALVLAIVVGGSSLIAAVTVFTGREVGVLTSVAAGLIMAGWIVVEVVMLLSASCTDAISLPPPRSLTSW
jgi:hypothetical protein